MQKQPTHFKFIGHIETTPIIVHFQNGYEKGEGIEGIEYINSGEYFSIDNYSDKLKMKLYDHLIKERDESISYEID